MRMLLAVAVIAFAAAFHVTAYDPPAVGPPDLTVSLAPTEFSKVTEADVGALGMWIQDAAKIDGRIPLQPWHWGSHYDPLYEGEGLNIEVIDNGEGANLLLVGYVYSYMNDTAQTPVWAFFNDLVQPSFVNVPGDPHYRFPLYRDRPNGEPFDDPPGWIELRVTPDARLAARLHIDVYPGDNLSEVTRFWILDQLTRPPGLEMARCRSPGGFSPPRPDHRFCVVWP